MYTYYTLANKLYYVMRIQKTNIPPICYNNTITPVTQLR